MEWLAATGPGSWEVGPAALQDPLTRREGPARRDTIRGVSRTGGPPTDRPTAAPPGVGTRRQTVTPRPISIQQTPEIGLYRGLLGRLPRARFTPRPRRAAMVLCEELRGGPERVVSMLRAGQQWGRGWWPEWRAVERLGRWRLSGGFQVVLMDNKVMV